MEPWEFDSLVEQQGGLCAICQSKVPTHLDHDHTTGEVRGALCVACNNGIGLFKDNAQTLASAVSYLKGGQ